MYAHATSQRAEVDVVELVGVEVLDGEREKAWLALAIQTRSIETRSTSEHRERTSFGDQRREIVLHRTLGRESRRVGS